MTRLMVLGGGRHQVPLIRRAEDRGLEVVVVDYYAHAPGHRIATYSEVADATDEAGAIRLARRYQIDGVITTGTDIPIRAMAAVAEVLDLPCYLSRESARTATDKEEMYVALAEHGVPMAERLVVGADAPSEAAVPMPVVVKPADSQGQRGITLVRRSEELPAAIDRALSSSRSKRVLLEEYAVGPEVTANAWIHDGAVASLFVNDRITFNPSPHMGIAYRHRYPSKAVERSHQLVRDVAQRVANAYGMKSGPLYIQMIATAEGLIVMEAAARVGGGHESSMLAHLVGWSTDETLIDLSLGVQPLPPPPLDEEAHLLVNFVLGSKGVVASCPEFQPAEGIVESGWYVSPGDDLVDVVDSLGRVGYFVAVADSREQLIRKADAYYSSLSLPSAEGTNLVHTPEERLLNVP